LNILLKLLYNPTKSQCELFPAIHYPTKEEHLNLDTGTIVVVAVILIFYLRLMVIQWGKAKHNRAATERDVSKRAKKNSKKAKDRAREDYRKLAFRTNPTLIIIGGLVLILGILSRATNWMPDFLETGWWVSTSIGIIIFGLGFK
jgi:small-conductance mechanosensitive channel